MTSHRGKNVCRGQLSSDILQKQRMMRRLVTCLSFHE
ncbi:rCG52582 [Rattus norvegicus]|uniref:RCG52582 n=1 Tax=Rattus norvegicus TaxID=10116 RepID=A6IQM3_RAT|nr:rCG52582 [Rattus norvegicus]